jgi:hypothetical protein
MSRTMNKDDESLMPTTVFTQNRQANMSEKRNGLRTHMGKRKGKSNANTNFTSARQSQVVIEDPRNKRSKN